VENIPAAFRQKKEGAALGKLLTSKGFLRHTGERYGEFVFRDDPMLMRTFRAEDIAPGRNR